MGLLPGRIIAGFIVAILCIFGIWGISQVWENVAADEIVVIQAPFSGELRFYTAPGTVLQNFGTVTTYQRRAALEFECQEEKTERTRTESVAGTDVPVKYMASTWTGGKDIRFNDGGHGTICGSLQYEMPEDHQQLRALYQRFKGQPAVEGLIKKQTDSAIYLAGQLMSSKESYNETRNDLIHYISDQIRNGVYRTRTKTVTTTDALTQKDKVVNIGEIILDKDGNPARQEASALHDFGIKIFNFTISRLPYDEQVEAQIQQQQKLTMDVQTSLAELRKAEQRKLTAEQQGMANATEEKWKQEAIKAQQVTLAEQVKEVAITKAEQERQVADLAKQAAEFTRQQNILLGEGESIRKKLVLQADGALEQKLATWLKANEAYAKAISSYSGNWVPTFVMAGGANQTAGVNGAQELIGLLTAKTARDLSLDLSVPAGVGSKQ